jgi:tRNA A-37 threonylcarbamoyl transferase component Bud32
MLICSFCGEKNPAGASFCDGCGGALSSAVAAQASARGAAQVAQATAQRQAVKAKQPPPAPFATGRLPPRTLLGKRYLVLKAVGQGGMAAVYQATDTPANRVVALKEMSQDGLSPEELKESLESFAAEAKLLKSLSHENLPKVYDSFSENARHYLVMEFIEGQTFEQRLAGARGPLPEGDALRWAAQLCAALTYLHTRKPPIIFRDLKPANIMLTPQGKVKLIDFGIARIFTPNRRRDTQALGTPGYAPPEQYGSAQTDARADVYALGATLYQLLTAYDVSKTPFALPPMQSRNVSISPHIRLAVERATRLDRAQRYTTIAEFQRDLLNPAGLYFQSGALARSPAELLNLLAAQPLDGADALYSGRVADWMTRWKRADLADAARRTVSAHGDRSTGLRAYLTAVHPQPGQRAQARPATARPTAKPGGGAAANRGQSAGQRGGLGPLVGAATSAATAGVVAAVSAGIKARATGQAGPVGGAAIKAGMKAAATTFASAAGSVALPTVQPRELDFGRVVAGQDAAGALTVSGQSGPVTGSVKALSSWIVVDKTQFNGVSTLISVTARTSAITTPGPQTGMIELAVATQRMYIPVKVDVAPAPRPVIPVAPPRPRSPAPRAARAGVAPVRRGPSVARMRLNSLNNESLRFSLSIVLAVALGVALAWGLPAALTGWVARYVIAEPLRAMLFLLLAAAAAAGGALIPYIGGQPAPGRRRTAALGAIIGGSAALNVSIPFLRDPTAAAALIFPEARSLGAVALTLPILVALGAAFGAQGMVSGWLLALARVISDHPGMLRLASAILGAWVGFTVSLAGLNSAFHQSSAIFSVLSTCGLVIGLALGLALSAPIGAITRRFATVP